MSLILVPIVPSFLLTIVSTLVHIVTIVDLGTKEIVPIR